jgi:hypothetical protein
MKKSLLYLVIAAFSLTMACSKEDDTQPASSDVQNVQSSQKQSSLTVGIEPLIRKSCSAAHCHNIGGRQLSVKSLQLAARNGTLTTRLAMSECACTFDPYSRQVLENWIADNSR